LRRKESQTKVAFFGYTQHTKGQCNWICVQELEGFYVVESIKSIQDGITILYRNKT